MPLFKIIRIDTNTKVFIWQIKESITALKKDLTLTDNAKQKYKKTKHLQHKKQFLATQQLLKLAGYTSAHLHYKNSGKPYLDTKKHISISHSNAFAVFAIAKNPIGIDIEKPQEKLKRIATKFINPADCATDMPTILQLTKLWTAKEAIYKLVDQKGLSFKQHIVVCKTANQEVKANVSFQDKEYLFKIYYFTIENCILALAI